MLLEECVRACKWWLPTTQPSLPTRHTRCPAGHLELEAPNISPTSTSCELLCVAKEIEVHNSRVYEATKRECHVAIHRTRVSAVAPFSSHRAPTDRDDLTYQPTPCMAKQCEKREPQVPCPQSGLFLHRWVGAVAGLAARWQAMAYGLWLRSLSCPLHGQRMGCPTGTETGQEWDGKVTTETQQHPDLVSVT